MLEVKKNAYKQGISKNKKINKNQWKLLVLIEKVFISFEPIEKFQWGF